jgi:hypothetical protein
MAEPPLCPNPKCRRPMTFLEDVADSYSFGCYSCGGTRIVSKPQTKAAAAHQVALQRRAVSEGAAKANPQRHYSFGGGKK